MLRKKDGVTLIELLIALAVSAFLMAGAYRIVIGQQKTHTVQEQVVEMQQNVRSGLDRMTREIRMAGYRKDLLASAGNIHGFTKVITSVNDANNIIGQHDDQITVIIKDKAITYRLQWDPADASRPVLVRIENGANEILADDIENLQIKYTLRDGTVTDLPALPESIRMVTVDVTARTKLKDPQLNGDGYLRRKLSSYMIVRNMGL